MTKGVELELNWFKDSANNHYEVSVQPSLQARDGRYYHNWYVYRPHVEIDEAGINLPVPYITQLEMPQPDRTCNTACSAMVLRYLGHNITGTQAFQQLTGDTTSHEVQTRLFQQYGVRSIFRTDLSFTDIEDNLKLNKPVIIGVLHRGSDAFPTGGHMVVVRGITPDGHYIWNDPYGSIHNGYADAARRDIAAVRRNGNGIKVERSIMQARWQTGRHTNAGWGRILL
jgi:uncharacterized protein YvpB